MTRVRKSWMVGMALLLAMSLQPTVTSVRAGGGWHVDPIDPSHEPVTYLLDDPGFWCEPAAATVTGQATWGINATNLSSSPLSHDVLYVTLTTDGVARTSVIFANINYGVATHFWIDPVLGLDGPPVFQFCTAVNAKIGEDPDPIVTLRQNPPPTW